MNDERSPALMTLAIGATTRPSCARKFRARAWVAAALALPALAHAACKIGTLEMPVKMVGSRAVATVGINGTPVPLTVDSGAFFSSLTDAAATQLQLRTRPLPMRIEGITGRIDARATTVETLKLLNGDISRVDFIVGGNEPGAGTMGLMGRNILAVSDVEYDLAHGLILFSYPNSDCAELNMAYWAGKSHVTQVELVPEYWNSNKAPAIRTRVKINGVELTAMFDTGATTVLSAQAARRAGITEAMMTASGSIHGAGRGTEKAWTASIDKFEIGDEAILHNRLHVGDFTMDDSDLLLGIDFFLAHRIYVSKQQSKMFLTYSGGTVFALNKSESSGAVPSGADPVASGVEAVNAAQLARRGAASASRRDFERALADLNRAVELEPTMAAYLAQRGTILAALGRSTKALEDFDKALNLDTTLADARLQRASLRFRARDRDGARSDLEALDKALAPQAQMRLAMARAYLDIDQPAQALVELNLWLPAHPNEIGRDVALNRRCWARVLLGNELDQALDDCNDAVDSDGKNPAFLDSRGWLHLRLGRNKNALADFDRSLELRPATAWSLYGRGLAKARLGDATQGDADLAAARKLQPDVDSRLKQAGLPMELRTRP